MAPRITVLGAGISGLSSAVCVQQACPEAEVQLVSEHFTPDTTSDGAAGFWATYFLGDTDPQLALKLSEVTYHHLLKLASSPLAGVVKVQRLSGYHFYKGLPVGNPPWKGVVEGFRQLTEEEMKQYKPFETGNFYTVITVDVTPYMEWLMKRFKSQGGILHQARVEKVEELASQCDILVNCSAMSSLNLFKDKDMFPVRGQVWKVRAPWIKHFYFLFEKDQNTTYVIPGVDFVTVGGTAQIGDWNKNVDPELGKLIWEKAVTHFPMLQHAVPVRAWAGLRPARKSLRLESETMQLHGRTIKVIHNYGHGGCGVTLHWGCALEVTKMILETLGANRDDAQRVVSRL